MTGVMEELSRFVCLMPRSSILTLEIDAAPARLMATPARFGNARLLAGECSRPAAGVAV